MLIKSAEQINKMRIACQLAAQVLEMIEGYAKPGISTARKDLSTIYYRRAKCHSCDFWPSWTLRMYLYFS